MPHGTGRCELDSHADTCIAGHGFVLYEETGDTCMVYPFSEKYEPIRVKIVNVVTNYTSSKGVNYILLFNNVLYLPDMEVSLLCPNQLRDHGLIVEDCPRQFDSSSGHCISTPDGNLVIPLEMDGVMSGFNITRPTKQQLDSCEWITMTSDTSWNPNSNEFKDNELSVSSEPGTGPTRCSSAHTDVSISELEAQLTYDTGIGYCSVGAVASGLKKGPVTVKP